MKFCPFVLKILSGNEILKSIKGNNSITDLQKMTRAYILSMSMHLQNLVKFFPYILKILSGNKIMKVVHSRTRLIPNSFNISTHVIDSIYFFSREYNEVNAALSASFDGHSYRHDVGVIRKSASALDGGAKRLQKLQKSLSQKKTKNRSKVKEGYNVCVSTMIQELTTLQEVSHPPPPQIKKNR